MSLLEEALRRQDERARRLEDARGAPAPGTPPHDRPAASAPGLPFTAIPCPEHASPRQAPVPVQARVIAVAAPLIVLLLFAALAWLLLRSGRPQGNDPGRPRGAGLESVVALTPAPVPQPPGMTNRIPVSPVPAASVATPSPAEPASPVVPPITTGTPDASPAPGPDAFAGTFPHTPPSPSAPLHAVAPAPSPAGGDPWPLVTLKGIAYGRERLVVLDTGEMLSSGERSRTGIRVVRVEPDRAWFEWHGTTNMLRRGETSEKPSQE